MQKILAKVKVRQVTETENDKIVCMTPVADDSPENKTFSKWTPSGEVRLHITNEAALPFFKVGKEVYVSFTNESPLAQPAHDSAPGADA